MFKIIGTGMYLPKKAATNEDFIKKWGDPMKLAFERLGHGIRYHAAENESSATLGIQAAKQAIANAKINPLDLSMIIVSTDTPSQLSPATAAQIQYELGAKNAANFDVNCACAGFVTAMDVASKYLAVEPNYKYVMVIGAYAMSKFLDPEDPFTAPLFGDGAGAIILEKSPKTTYASTLIADGQYWDYMGIYIGSNNKITHENIDKKLHTVKIPKKYPATLNNDFWPGLIEQTIKKVNWKIEDVDMYIFTQLRKFSIMEMMETFKLPMTKTHTIMEKWGYTGSACIPMALHDAIENKKIKHGDKVVLCVSGGGYSMANIAFVY